MHGEITFSSAWGSQTKSHFAVRACGDINLELVEWCHPAQALLAPRHKSLRGSSAPCLAEGHSSNLLNRTFKPATLLGKGGHFAHVKNGGGLGLMLFGQDGEVAEFAHEHALVHASAVFHDGHGSVRAAAGC